jgi:CHASE2 domain-containing sensor protein
MDPSIDPVLLLNIILCLFILVMGLWEYQRSRAALALYIGIAFGLFGISHLMLLLGLGIGMTPLLISIRLIAYLLVIAGLFHAISLKKRA